MNNAHKLALAASISLAAAFTLSCSNGGDDENNGGGGSKTTETYSLTSVGDDTFKFTEVEEWYECNEGGILEKITRDYPQTIGYSIENNILIWETYRDTLNFSGTSSSLTGKWTRTKDRAASCEIGEDDEDYYDCKRDWDIVEVVFTATNVSIKRDYCQTDRMVSGYTNKDGVKQTVINCNDYEFSKGTDVVKIKNSKSSSEAIYNGKTCKITYKEYSQAERQSACTKAWNKQKTEPIEYWEDYYDEFLHEGNDSIEAAMKCIEDNNFPTWFH